MKIHKANDFLSNAHIRHRANIVYGDHHNGEDSENSSIPPANLPLKKLGFVKKSQYSPVMVTFWPIASVDCGISDSE